jgi:methylated-DNA-[protein]-cysteine S-methyltransferase
MNAYYLSPVGWIEISAKGDRLSSLFFVEKQGPAAPLAGVLKECCLQLDQYFKGERKTFDLPLETGGTEFQKRVWSELLRIPFGETISYLELSRRLGNVKAIRAVGGANGKNPLSIIIPCHRVIGNNGKLVGYGGGLWRKRWLLEFERSLTVKDLFTAD